MSENFGKNTWRCSSMFPEESCWGNSWGISDGILIRIPDRILDRNSEMNLWMKSQRSPGKVCWIPLKKWKNLWWNSCKNFHRNAWGHPWMNSCSNTSKFVEWIPLKLFAHILGALRRNSGIAPSNASSPRNL